MVDQVKDPRIHLVPVMAQKAQTTHTRSVWTIDSRWEEWLALGRLVRFSSAKTFRQVKKSQSNSSSWRYVARKLSKRPNFCKSSEVSPASPSISGTGERASTTSWWLNFLDPVLKTCLSTVAVSYRSSRFSCLPINSSPESKPCTNVATSIET